MKTAKYCFRQYEAFFQKSNILLAYFVIFLQNALILSFLVLLARYFIDKEVRYSFAIVLAAAIAIGPLYTLRKRP